MEIKDRQIRFWQMLAFLTFVYIVLGFVLQVFQPFNIGGSPQSIVGYITGGIVGIWLIIAPIAYFRWIKPYQTSIRPEPPAKDENAETSRAISEIAKPLGMRYRFNILYLAFFITVMVLQFIAYIVLGGKSMFTGFWLIFTIVIMGLANLSAIIQQSQIGRTWTQNEVMDRRNRLNRWWILVLSLAVVWLIVVVVVLPRVQLELYYPLVGMLAGIWIIVVGISHMLYVSRYPITE